jgi:hypothetical protein
LVISLAVVALLFLLGLLCCVVLMVFLGCGAGFGGSDVALDLPGQRLELVDDPHVFVVPHHTRLRAVIREPDRRRTQADRGQVRRFDAGNREAHRQREKCHAKRHGKARLAHHCPDWLDISGDRGLHPLQPRNLRLGGASIYPQALGVNARRGCQNCCDQVGWRLHLRETLQPAASRLSFGEQRAARFTYPGVRLEPAEFASAQDAVNGVGEQQIELVTPHSVTGLVWHHITCL